MMQALKSVKYLTTSTMKQAGKTLNSVPLCPVSELSVAVPWGEIRGRVWGPEHGRPVLCLHGWADNCGTFNKLIPLLPKECRYVAVDLAGHGFSSHRPPGVFYTFPSYVADVCRVVSALRWDRFSIIGHSMGGNVAGMYSALYPEMVDAIVLLDSYGFMPTDQKKMTTVVKEGIEGLLEFEKKSEQKKEKIYTYEEAVKRLSEANPFLSEDSVHILLERGLVQTDGGVMFSRDFRINLKNIARISVEQSLEMQSRIRASVLVVLAENGFEKILTEANQMKFPPLLLQGYRDQNHKVVTVPGDHHVHLNNPEFVAPLVSDFLRSDVLGLKETPKL
ncbi:serine hydrolase-like protein isoform X1 [Periophthalmus magnuspinnatus]|uniref:serine hydrolase-like protein isoform X1 n=1 Tax=Periophthalmus magnuspinnatus TaxID=409849 RepID=UPI002436856C|nr:serine hydrolase-like protein isoform X1 [Periophthalmus magnuspinnatus]